MTNQERQQMKYQSVRMEINLDVGVIPGDYDVLESDGAQVLQARLHGALARFLEQFCESESRAPDGALEYVARWTGFGNVEKD